MMAVLAEIKPQFTPGPWRWYLSGKYWLLWGAHGMRPIILDVFRDRLRLRDFKRDVMVDFSPEHPNARLIEASPELFAALQQTKAALACYMEIDEGNRWEDKESYFDLLEKSADAMSVANRVTQRVVGTET